MKHQRAPQRRHLSVVHDVPPDLEYVEPTPAQRAAADAYLREDPIDEQFQAAMAAVEDELAAIEHAQIALARLKGANSTNWDGMRRAVAMRLAVAMRDNQ